MTIDLGNYGNYCDSSIVARIAVRDAELHARAAHLPDCMKGCRESFLDKLIKKTLKEMRGKRDERTAYILVSQ